MKYARTGLKLEMSLYRLAQKKAEATNRSFASYVVDLLAIALKDEPGATSVPDIQRVLGIIKQTDPIEKLEIEIGGLENTISVIPPGDAARLTIERRIEVLKKRLGENSRKAS